MAINKYGFDVTLRKRTPTTTDPEACPCVASDDVFHQINPNCDICGGTGIVGGETLRDSTERIMMQPDRELGFMGSGTIYAYPTKMERIWEVCYAKGDIPADIGDFIIDSYAKPDGDTATIEYEIYDKEAWWLGQGGSRRRKVIYYKLLIRKTEYAKTITEVESY
jgi:hypothetical protein